VLLVLSLTVLVLGGVGVVLTSSLRGWTEAVVDDELTRRADVLVNEAHLDEGRLELDDDDDLASRGLPFRIERTDGRLLIGSQAWPSPAPTALGFVSVESPAARIWTQTFVPRRGTEPLVLRVAAPLTAYTRLSDRFRTGLFVALVLAALLSALGAAGLAQGFLSPLRRISGEIDHLEARKLEGRLDVRGLDPELGRLASTFNALLDRVSVVMHGQRDFVGRASHALRTPLASILTQAEVALRRERNAADYRVALESIAASTRDAARLTDGLLALMRADAATPVAKELVRLSELGAELERLFRPRAEAAGLTLELVTSPDAEVSVSRARVREVLDALLDNAVRYTPRGGTVRFSAALTGDVLALEVSDTGPGIAADEQPHLFERFFRGRAAEQSAQPGSGLGLSLVKALVAAEGGSLTASAPPGARFRIELPLTSSPSSSSELPPAPSSSSPSSR
jgi:signal transduction histidine kinase